MSNIKNIFSLPKEYGRFKDVMASIQHCSIVSSKTIEGDKGPEIQEVYKCPCGDITLKQKSIITNIDHPEKGSIEIIDMRSDGCAL